jgi:hypothetical protein
MNTMHTQNFSILSAILAIAVGILVPSASSFAAKPHKTKPAAKYPYQRAYLPVNRL